MLRAGGRVLRKRLAGSAVVVIGLVGLVSGCGTAASGARMRHDQVPTTCPTTLGTPLSTSLPSNAGFFISANEQRAFATEQGGYWLIDPKTGATAASGKLPTMGDDNEDGVPTAVAAGPGGFAVVDSDPSSGLIVGLNYITNDGSVAWHKTITTLTPKDDEESFGVAIDQGLVLVGTSTDRMLAYAVSNGSAASVPSYLTSSYVVGGEAGPYNYDSTYGLMLVHEKGNSRSINWMKTDGRGGIVQSTTAQQNYLMNNPGALCGKFVIGARSDTNTPRFQIYDATKGHSIADQPLNFMPDDIAVSGKFVVVAKDAESGKASTVVILPTS